MENDRLNLAIEIAKKLLFKPYRWGGETPMTGYDCSGFIIEVLKSVGLLPKKGDWTADGLSQKFPVIPEIKIGALVFFDYNKSKVYDHVEMVCAVFENGDVLTIGASGGNRLTTNDQTAIKQEAYIKMRKLTEVPDLIAYPF